MAKPKPNLAATLDGLPETPAPSQIVDAPAPRRRSSAKPQEPTAMVGANLPTRYARNLAMLHAETGRGKKELIQEALDMLFTAKASPNLKL